MSDAILWYDANAEDVSRRYESVAAETVHAWIVDLLPSAPALVLDEGAREGERASSPGGVRSDAGQADPSGGYPEKLLNSSRRRRCIDHVRDLLGLSEHRTCRVLGQHRSTQRHVPCTRADEELLVADMIELTRQYGRYGYRRIAALTNRPNPAGEQDGLAAPTPFKGTRPAAPPLSSTIEKARLCADSTRLHRVYSLREKSSWAVKNES